MCGSAVNKIMDDWLGIGPPPMPDIVAVDPQADRARAEGEAAAAANKERTARRRAARASALSTARPTDSAASGQASTAMAYGKAKLGE